MVRFNICFNRYLFDELKVATKCNKLEIYRFTIFNFIYNFNICVYIF